MNTSKTNSIILTTMLLLSTASFAQTPIAIPVPSQFATAHNIFLSSGGALPLGSNEEQYISLLYPSTYKMLQSIGSYQLVSSPANSDLTFEISALQQTGASVLRLEVRDTKTHALLWDIDAGIGYWSTSKDAQTVIDVAENRLADQLRTLIAGTIPAPAPKKK